METGFDIGSFAGSLIQSGVNFYQGQQQLSYDKWLQKKMWKREDNAVQRRSADLEAAGLSKTLAAGSAASAGPVVATNAPRLEGLDTAVQNVLNARKAQVDISKTKADEANTVASTAATAEAAKGTALDNEYKQATLQDRVVAQAATTDIKQQEVINKNLDAEISRNNIALQDVEKVKASIAVESARMGLTQQQQDIAAKNIAIDNAKYNRTFYEYWGLPTDASIGGQNTSAAMLMGAFDQARKAKGKMLSPEDLKKAKDAESRGAGYGKPMKGGGR